MPLSNYIAPSAIAKPGVCTSSTRPASPYEGQVIYETDTDKTLVWNGSAWVYLSTSTANPVGLEFITSQTVGSAVSTVSISNCFSSTYANYRIIVDSIDGNVSATSFFIRFDAGGSTNYYSSVYYDFYAGTDTSTLRRNGQPSGGVGVIGTNDNTCLNVDVFCPNLVRRTIWAGTFHGDGYQGWCGGQDASTTQHTGFTLLPNSGTMTGGTIRVYGYRN